jgi:type I restriction enzyme S subunit
MSKIKLGDITKIRTGKLDANASSENGKYPFFTCSKDPLRIDSYSYDCECVLVAGNGDLNVKYYKGKFDAYQRTYIIEDNSNGRLYMPYLYYYLYLYVEELRKQSIGGVIKYIKLGNLTDALIDLPSIETQKETIRILDKSRKIIENKNMQLQEYDQLIKSRFVEMFGDPESNTKKYRMVNLSDIARYFNGLTYSPENVSDEGIIVLRSNNIQNSKLDYKDLVRVRLNVKESKIVRENDILMCSRNGSAKLVGKVALLGNLPEKMAFGAFMMIIRSEYYAYLMSYFQMDAFRRQITTGATTTINQITSRMLDNIRLPLPEKSQVKEFELLVKQVDKLKFEVQNSLNETQMLFDSLMQEYFG